MDREKLMRAVDEADLWDGDLGDLVHDVASEIASDVNNNGLESQIDWLLGNGVSAAEIAEELGLEVGRGLE